jgi:HK97 family phage portal protein
MQPNVTTRRRWFRRKSEDRALTEEQYPWLAQLTSTGFSLSPLAALRLPAVLACVRLLAESASTLPLRVYQGTGPNRVPVTGGLSQLLERPSPGTTTPNFVASLVAHMAMQGEVFVGKFRNAEGQIEQLAMLPPDRVSVELVGGFPIYTLSLEGGTTEHSTYDILHLKMISLDGIRGISPLHHAREALGLAAATQETASSLFSNGAIPRGVLAVNAAGADGEELRQNLSDGFKERHGGPRNAGRVAVVDAAAVTYSGVGLSPADAELIGQMKMNDAAIARAFRVPASKIGAETGSSLTYSTVEGDTLDFIRFTLSPYLVVIEAGLSTDPDLALPDECVEFDLAKFSRPDSLAAAQSAALGRQWGWLTADDVRTDEGRPPLAEPLPILSAVPTQGDANAVAA